jgi:hypothetical protein
MSTIAATSPTVTAQEYFSTRRGDLNQLGQALSSGNTASAEKAFSNIVALGKTGVFKNGDPFAITQREQDFSAIGQALQSGDLAGAQQAFAALKSTFGAPHPTAANPVTSAGGNNTEPLTPSITSSLNGGAGADPLSVTA